MSLKDWTCFADWSVAFLLNFNLLGKIVASSTNLFFLALGGLWLQNMPLTGTNHILRINSNNEEVV